MAVIVTVLYPPGDFDLDYYLKTHMPLVEKTWKSKGLTDWKITKLNPQPDGTPSPYQMQAILTFESKEAFQAAAEEDGTEIFGDIPKFTSTQPTIVQGDAIAGMS